MKITEDRKIVLDQDFIKLEIDSSDKLELEFEPVNDCNVFININSVNELTVKGETKADQRVSLFFWNGCNEPVCISSFFEVKENGELILGFGECNGADTFIDATVELKEKKAKATVSTASLVNSEKDYRIRVINSAVNTEAQIKNYAVVLNKGRLTIDAVGKIVNGAHKSRSHQVSRALSFEEGQKVTILPELLIDENDVQASHAMSIGRVDENQLYYMMSRGLNIRECTMLISMGYLLPIADIIEDKELQDTIRNQLENRIRELCLM
ncbi:MAG: SufD family Fe-S cluster assembly protein [Erysipelotrichaceae bacterium]|nr:SufD family Fe-S cluster assembly protein [Erysipelotrichaceae bacterium]